MRAHPITATLAVLVFLGSTGCASLLRKKERGSAAAPVCVRTMVNPDHVRALLLGGKEVERELIYDGRLHGSPFFVFRAFPPNSEDLVKVTLRTDSGDRQGSAAKESEGFGWFWVSGLGILVDWATGALSFYHDAIIP